VVDNNTGKENVLDWKVLHDMSIKKQRGLKP
jgi:hypothetical protein